MVNTVIRMYNQLKIRFIIHSIDKPENNGFKSVDINGLGLKSI